MFKKGKIKRVIKVPGTEEVKEACFAYELIEQKFMKKARNNAERMVMTAILS